MAKYFVANALQDRTHAVHREGCPMLQDGTCIYLGDFISSQAAVNAARRLLFTGANGCLECTPECYRIMTDDEDIFRDDDDVTPVPVLPRHPP